MRRPVLEIDEGITLWQPRVASLVVVDGTHTVTRDDRLDRLAHAVFRDPLQYWRICDANPTLRPDEVLEIGHVLDLPGSDRG